MDYEVTLRPFFVNGQNPNGSSLSITLLSKLPHRRDQRHSHQGITRAHRKRLEVVTTRNYNDFEKCALGAKSVRYAPQEAMVTLEAQDPVLVTS